MKTRSSLCPTCAKTRQEFLTRNISVSEDFLAILNRESPMDDRLSRLTNEYIDRLHDAMVYACKGHEKKP